MTRIIPTRTARWAAVAAVVVTGASATASLAGSAPAACRITVPITISSTHAHHAFTSGTGSASCTGALGPWLLGSGGGWSRVHGTLTPAAHSGLSSAQGQLVAAVPRLAFPSVPMVLMTMTLHVHSSGNALALTGSGHLVPTVRSPAHAHLTVTGAATLTGHVLTLQFSVKSS